MLPSVAVDNLITAVFEFCDLAAEEQVADGYLVLNTRARCFRRAQPLKKSERCRRRPPGGQEAERQVIQGGMRLDCQRKESNPVR